ncbi:Wzz/FepE/Etk N-terminal domain-containing protein [Noviherbaspirillum sedimenti]|uniref:Polysaccharide chain length determinant N-terminal domain-containing protein n=1 Tax=Noviherbaspirillum sedimenti TaxID=2320865 RepID=A0A3A3GPM5_9BURK|nr:Wzz/FepE/Etk N-terminal domain-containing protein [Noviherbaspirillum sedimenti]RJG02940.1 hypothetical protein D3878_16250 [Noviherbaspirillum sedimenti]
MQNILLATPSNITTIPEEEMNLHDIVQFFKDGKRWIIASTLICLLLGGTYAMLTPAKFEASANLEMAMVAGTPVEVPSILAEKLKLPLYYSSETFNACQVEKALPSPGQVLASQLKPVANKNAPIVSIRFKGLSPDAAQRCLTSVISDVSKNQGALSKPILDTKKSQLHTLERKLAEAEKLLALLPVKDMKFVFDDGKFSASALLLATLMTKDHEITELRNQINDKQLDLAEPQTKGTTLVTPIYAPSGPVEPNKALIVLSSAIAGILFGLMFLAGRKVFAS